MKVIGIAGPAGSGKSTVARLLARRPGFGHLDCDAIAWATYRPGGPAYSALLARFGAGIVAGDGTVDRARLAQTALADPQLKADLEAIVHPWVMDEVRRAIERHRAGGTTTLLVEGALLLSSPHVDRSLFDAFVWLSVPEEERRERLLGAGLDPKAVDRRLGAQHDLLPPDRPGVHIVDGRGSPDEIARHVVALLDRLEGS